MDNTCGNFLVYLDGNSYARVYSNDELRQAVQMIGPTNNNVLTIYFTTRKKDKPEKIFGTVPYNLVLDAVEASSKTPIKRRIGGVNRSQKSIFASHSKVQKSNVAGHPALMPDLPPCYTSSCIGAQYSAVKETTNSNASNFGTGSENLRELQPENLGSSNSGPNSNTTAAIQTLRNMGFTQDESVLNYYITDTNGDLNKIIDAFNSQSKAEW